MFILLTCYVFAWIGEFYSFGQKLLAVLCAICSSIHVDWILEDLDQYELNEPETQEEELQKAKNDGVFRDKKDLCRKPRICHDCVEKGLKILRQNEKVTTRWMHESSCLESVRKDSGAQCPPMTANFFTVFQIDVMYMCVTMERLSHPTRSICFGLKPKSDVTPGSNGVEDLLVHNDTPKTNDDYIKDLGDQEDPPDIEDFKDLLEPKNTNTDADLTQKNNKYYVSDVQNAISRKNGTCEELYVENDVQDGEADEESEVDLVNFGSEIDLHLHSTFLKANEAKICDTESVLSDLREDHGNCAAGCDMGTFYKMSVGPDKTFVCLPNPEKTKDVSHEDKMPQFTLKVLPNPPNNFERYSQVKSVQDNSLLNCFERKFVKEDQQSRGKQYDLTLLESDIESLRKVSWLPLHNLPVPKVEIDVHYVDQFPPLVAIITQIAEGNTPRPQISMRYELLRLCTLRTYPRENKPYLIKLAAAGFYYASDGDGVVCYCCGIRRYGWTEKDDPMAVHKRINQHCKFFKKNAEYNVPATSFGPLSEKEAFLDAIPDCEVPNYSEDVNNDNDNNRQSGQPTTQNRTGLGIQTSMPKHPQYAPKTTRENSYNGWPNTSSHTPIELAEAGFYFAGFGDCVRCFHCGIGLRHWDKEDNVWIEHARWSKDCVFLLQKKGREFVELVQLAVQYTNELEDQTGATGTSGVVDLEKYLVGEAAQFVLTKGFTPIQIKESLEAILSKDSNAKITGHSLLQKVIELHGKKNEPAPEDNTNSANSAPESTESSPETVEKQARGENTEAAVADPKAIKEENEQLKEQTVCKVCLDNTVSIVFLPCGHLVTCADCAPAMRKCPICRAVVKGTVRTYMS
ncbi:uncharacterized protein LOC128238475 [Mya arenaria]|uniref:uncharacterized protein LOC128238475 n=1 Tax=Mya arenaria TaxID=6604 RepID=UPI0022E70196|nr:uncharacterized protein LOC128238475 [Mya arenaria]XP_052810394.1 uncharacterized protein LOC128238475 [Mya arenaria]XP_052810395.1 uncharacterized protein LOC128238475 [Mya arenaria]